MSGVSTYPAPFGEASKEMTAHERGESLTRATFAVALTTTDSVAVAVGHPDGAGTVAETSYDPGLKLSDRQPLPTACPMVCPRLLIVTVALSGASTSNEPTVRTTLATVSFGGSVSLTAGVTGGDAGGGVTAAAESAGFTGGGAASPERHLLSIDAPTVRPAMSTAPAIHGALEERFGALPLDPAAGYPSDRTTTVGSEPVIRVRYADVSSVAGRRATSS
jgi:hypothetical protein